MTKHGMIYFITDGEAIKIGFTTRLRARLRKLQTSHHFPLLLLGSIPAMRTEENMMHRRFAHLRLHGEWFRADPEITDLIDAYEEAGQLIEGERFENFVARVHMLNDVTPHNAPKP